MKTLLEQVINELRLSKAVSGNKLKAGKRFCELQVGDMLYFVYISNNHYRNGQDISYNHSGPITRKDILPNGLVKVYFKYRKNAPVASFTLNTKLDGFDLIDGDFTDENYCILKYKEDWYFFATAKDIVKDLLKKHCDIELKDIKRH